MNEIKYTVELFSTKWRTVREISDPVMAENCYHRERLANPSTAYRLVKHETVMTTVK